MSLHEPRENRKPAAPSEPKKLSSSPTPASSTTGFFQEPPRIPNQFHEDASFRRALDFFLPAAQHANIRPDLESFGAFVLSPQVRERLVDAGTNLPYVRTWDTWGKRRDELVTSEGWRKSTETATREGLVALGYYKEYGRHARVYQFLKTYLWGPSSCGVTCPSAMQDGAAALLARHTGKDSQTPEDTKKVLRSALNRLLSRDPAYAWTSGQWMTERPGGSDVRNTETRATFDPDAPAVASLRASDGSQLGPWRIDGFKWFSSATDANMTVLLAKTGDSDDISAFFAPTRTRAPSGSPDTDFNGIQIQRLKSKLGTHSLPTAELVLSGTRAHILGGVGQGTKEISSILNITRIHTAVGGVAAWGRGLAVSRAFSRVRKTSGRLLQDVPAHVRGLAEQHVAHRAYTLFTYFVVSLLGIAEAGGATPGNDAPAILPASPETASHILRLLTPVLKSQASLAAIAGLRFSMESLGGVGYLENQDPELNVARLFRDTNVLSIWEGTTDVLASDAVRVVAGTHKRSGGGEGALGTLQRWVAAWLEGVASAEEDYAKAAAEAVAVALDAVASLVRGALGDADAAAEDEGVQKLLYHGRELMQRVAWIVCAVVLVEDARRDGDEVAAEVARRWIRKGAVVEGAGVRGEAGKGARGSWREDAAWDRRIVFGSTGGGGEVARL